MKKNIMSIISLCLVVFALQLVIESKASTWTDPEKAAAENSDFLLQGEYLGVVSGREIGLQAAAMGQGRFLVAVYRGGLPGAGWDGSKISSELLERDALRQRVVGLDRVERVSPTAGLKAPEGSVVVFDGNTRRFIDGQMRDGLLWVPAVTTTNLSDFVMHVEFRLPFKPDPAPSNQDRGNSGLYIFNNYECQILDTFALDFDVENNPFKLHSDSKQWGGCLYKFKTPDINISYPPLQWQTFDIKFKAPVFKNGKKSENARITVYQNGVKIHDDVELPRGTGLGATRPEKSAGVVIFQDHGNPVAFRNVWIRPE